MFGDGHQFKVGIAEVRQIGHQGVRQFAPVVEAAVGVAAPGTGVDFVDVHRRVQPVPRCARLHPAGVAPDVAGRCRYDGGGARPQLEALRARIGLHHHLAGGPVADFEFVQVAGSQAGNEQFPDAGAAARAHRVHASVPVVEAADHRDPLGVRRPHRETHAVDAIHLGVPGAQAAPGLEQPAFVEQVDFLVRQKRAEGIGVGDFETPSVDLDRQAPGPVRRQRTAPFEEATPIDQAQLGGPLRQQERDPLGVGTEHAQYPSPGVGMQTQQGEGVVVAGGEETFDGLVHFGHSYWAPSWRGAGSRDREHVLRSCLLGIIPACIPAK